MIRQRKRTLADVINFTEHYIDGDEIRLLEKWELEDRVEDCEIEYRNNTNDMTRGKYMDAIRSLNSFKDDCRNIGSKICED